MTLGNNMHIKFVNISEKDFLAAKLIYKMLPLEYALAMLQDKTIWFAKPETWKDPFERRFIDDIYNINGEKRVFPWKGRVFCCCMSISYGSEAQWKAYGNGDIVVAFKIRREVLLDALDQYAVKNNVKIFIGKVEYQKTKDIKRPIGKNEFFLDKMKSINSLRNDMLKARLLLLKRIAFAYENEVRIIIVKEKISKDDGFTLHYNCDNTDLIDTISLDPNIGENEVVLLKEYLASQYGFKPIKTLKGQRPRIVRSELYKDLTSTIITV